MIREKNPEFGKGFSYIRESFPEFEKGFSYIWENFPEFEIILTLSLNLFAYEPQGEI